MTASRTRARFGSATRTPSTWASIPATRMRALAALLGLPSSSPAPSRIEPEDGTEDGSGHLADQLPVARACAPDRSGWATDDGDASLRPIARTHAARRVRAALVRHKVVGRVTVFAPFGDAGTIHLTVEAKEVGGALRDLDRRTPRRKRMSLAIIGILVKGGPEDSAAEILPAPRHATVARAVHTALKGYRVLPAPSTAPPSVPRGWSPPAAGR
jgi:hypothetical protein